MYDAYHTRFQKPELEKATLPEKGKERHSGELLYFRYCADLDSSLLQIRTFMLSNSPRVWVMANPELDLRSV